jgi:uncharacterized membrane protein YccC
VADLEALKSAARAAIVMPCVFAFAHEVIGNAQTSLFSAFGSFAVLVLVEFGGLPKRRLVAYLAFAAVGAVLITVGTLCSHDEWLAAGATAVVTFIVLFAGAFSGYFAAASTGAILLFVLPANIPAASSAIPDRLLGWALAAGVGTAASLLLWPPRRRADLRRAVAGATREVVALIEAEPEQRDERAAAARTAVDGLARSFLGPQHRPTGTTEATAALAALPDELDWLLSFLAEPTLDVASAEAAETLAAAAAVLDASIDRLEGGGAQADFERLEQARSNSARALLRTLPEIDMSAGAALDRAFRTAAAADAARQVAIYAMHATDGNVPPEEARDVGVSTRGTVGAAEQLVVEHASMRSVWLQNSIRGAVALGAAVYIAQRAGLRHGFWVVLGTLSVLRSNALGTGWSIVTALLGTAAGILVGSLVVIAIGTHHAVLWIALPLAVFLAAYAPRAISFAAGQAGFTVVLIILFNLIQPVGWMVGVVRIEDVAVGFAISLGVGVLFWPRGAAAVVREDLATAYARGADYVVAAARKLVMSGDANETSRAARAADTAVHLLEDAFRQYLVERSATRMNVEDVAALVGGAARLRRAAQSLVALGTTMGVARLDRCGENLDGELNGLHAWYVSLGYAIVNERRVPPPHLRDDEGRRGLFECVRGAVGRGDTTSKQAALVLVLTLQYLETLRRLEAHVAARANALLRARAEPAPGVGVSLSRG